MLSKLAVPLVALETVLGAAALDLNVILNAIMLIVAAAVAWLLLKSRVKDGTISDLEAANRAKDERLKEQNADLAGVRSRADAAEVRGRELRAELAAAQARYEEQAKYTAEGAVTQLERELSEHRQQVAERHELILKALEQLAARLNT